MIYLFGSYYAKMQFNILENFSFYNVFFVYVFPSLFVRHGRKDLGFNMSKDKHEKINKILAVKITFKAQKYLYQEKIY